MARIFCVEDDMDTRKILQVILGKDHELVFFDGLKSIGNWFMETQNAPRSSMPNMVLLDISLPDGSGMEFMAEMGHRLSQAGIGVIFLTGTNSTLARIRGFTLGAVDYISKPFDPMELMVRVNSKLRAMRPVGDAASQLKTRRLEIDLSKQLVMDLNAPEQRPIKLTPVEFRLLVLLVQQFQSSPQLPVSREVIAHSIFGEKKIEAEEMEKLLQSRSIDHHVSTLRKKLNIVEHQIESIYGIGYRLVA